MPISLTSNALTLELNTTLLVLEKWNAIKNPLSLQNIPSCGDKPLGQQGTRSWSLKLGPMIEHLFHFNLKPIHLVIEIEATNENLPSKNVQYKHVLTILQKKSSISQIVEMPKPTKTLKSSKVNFLS